METVTTPDVTTQEVPLDARLRIAHSDPEISRMDSEMSIALVKELEKYDRHRLDVISSYRLVPPVLMYGDPLEPSHPKRYEYWPSQRDNFPLLYEAARIILCVRYHSMGNERDHSVMGRIFSKVRGTLRGDSLEMLVLGHHFLHRELQSSKARIDAQLSSGIDPQQIEDEFDEHSMNGAIAPGAGSESESDDD